jgi:hypothetical protein
MVPVPKDGALVYGETFVFDVAPGHAGELRVQLFKKREGIVADSKAVVANAGVYVKNIVTHITAHGAIDKDFKLFSKGGEASGGFVRLRVLYEAIADETGAPGETTMARRRGMKTPTRRTQTPRRRRSRRAGRGRRPAT